MSLRAVVNLSRIEHFFCVLAQSPVEAASITEHAMINDFFIFSSNTRPNIPYLPKAKVKFRSFRKSFALFRTTVDSYFRKYLNMSTISDD